MTQHLEVRREGPIVTVLLNRPEKLNALTDDVLVELIDLIAGLERDHSARVVVLGGNGRSFCAGFDLTHRKQPVLTAAQWQEHARLANRAYAAIWESRLPFVSMVQGHCLGGGCELAVVCDITVAADDASFGEPEVRFGTGPLFNALSVAAGFKAAMYLLLTGETVSADEAQRLGLVTQVVPAESLQKATRQIAERLAMSPPSAVNSFKRAVQRVYEAAGFRVMADATAEQFAFVQLETADDRAEFRRVAKERGFKAAYSWLEDQQRAVLSG